MISLVNLVPTVDEGETKQAPLNQSFGEGVHYLAASQKNLFDICSFSFVGIDEGSLNIDDVEVTNDVSTLGRIIVYRIAVDGFASLSAVFILPNGFKAAYARRKEISASIASLRDLPSDTLENKAKKFSALYDTLEKENASYVLLDGSVKLNHQNKENIDKILANKKLTTIVLTYVPKVVVKTVKPQVIIDEEGDFARYAKKEGSTFAFLGIFALIFSFGLYGSICLFTGGNVGLGVTLILVTLACLIMDFVVTDSIYVGAKKYLENRKSYLKVQILSAFVALVACAVGLLIGYLCASNNVILPEEGSIGLSAAICLLGDVIVVLFAIFLSWPGKMWSKIKKIFSRK